MKDLFKVENSSLPENWESKTIDQLFDFFGGFSASRSQLTNIGSLYLHYGDIHNLSKTYINVDEDDNWLPRLDKDPSTLKEQVFLQNGDIVFADASEDYEGIGKSVVIENPSNENFVSGLHTIIARDKSTQLDIKYKRYCFSTYHVREQFRALATGTSVYGISKSNIGKIVILIPSIEEQQKIAGILSILDEQIEQTNQLIEKTKELKKGLMQKLLTKGIGHTDFKTSEIGEIPANWEVKSLDSLCSLKGRIGWRGYTKQDLRDSGPLVIGATQISSLNRLEFSNPVYISREKYEESPEIKVFKGDIILVKTGNTIGKVAYVDRDIGEATINPNTALIKEIKCDNRFLFYLISSEIVQSQIKNSITVGAQPSINQKTLKSILAPLPSKLEQEKISAILFSIDEKLVAYEKLMDSKLTLKKGLMQKLLTGKIRVKE